jgi:menaquinone-9 beta-reductase
MGVRRPLLHAKMIQRAVSVGVQLMWSTTVIALGSTNVDLTDGKSISSRWIVGADGSQSRVRTWAGLDDRRGVCSRFARRQHYRIAPWSYFVDVYWSDRTQAYATAISPEEVCVVLTGRNPKSGLQDSLNEFPELLGRLKGADAVSSERGTITSMRRLPRVTRGNVALIGDASGSVDAITGEGLSLSFRQADVLAQAILRNDLAAYEREHRLLSFRPTYMARLMLLLDGRPRLRRRALRAFQQGPHVFGRLLSHHIGLTSPAHFAATGAMFGWRFLAA